LCGWRVCFEEELTHILSVRVNALLWLLFLVMEHAALDGLQFNRSEATEQFRLQGIVVSSLLLNT
jgi:hypothetical protein